MTDRPKVVPLSLEERALLDADTNTRDTSEHEGRAPDARPVLPVHTMSGSKGAEEPGARITAELLYAKLCAIESFTVRIAGATLALMHHLGVGPEEFASGVRSAQRQPAPEAPATPSRKEDPST